MKSFDQFKKEQLVAKPALKAAYEQVDPQFELARQIIEARLKKGLSQAQLAAQLGTGQSSIARLESGSYNPSVKFLTRVAHATGTRLKVELES